MKARRDLSCLLAGTISFCALTAGGEFPSKAADGYEADQSRPERKPLPGLAERCQKMLDMQIAVRDGTKGLHKAIEGNDDKKPRPKDKEILVKLSEKQKAVIVDATNAIETLRADGVAIAFTEVFEDLRADMKRVQSRLEMSDIGKATQVIEDDIVETLQEMIRALEK